MNAGHYGAGKHLKTILANKQARLSLFGYLLGITRVVLLIYLTRYFMMDDPVILDTPQIMYPNG